MKVSRQGRSQKNVEPGTIVNEATAQDRTLPLDTKGKEARGGSSYTQKDMEIVKSLSRMFLMWGMFFVVAIISATGSTFFILQYSNLNVSKKIPVQIYNVVQDFSGFAVPVMYNLLYKAVRKNKVSGASTQKNEKIKIGFGMFCGIISCLFAWRLEVYRLKEVGKLVNKDLNTSISFLWLVPQFFVLGCMEGLTRQGLLNFYRSQLKEEPLVSYGEEYLEIVTSLGKLANIILVISFNSQLGWFGDTINDSRLDKYYLRLVYVSSANILLYCGIAIFFYKDQNLANNDLGTDNKALVDDESKQGNQDLADDALEQVDQILADYNEKEDNQVSADYDDQEQDNQGFADDW